MRVGHKCANSFPDTASHCTTNAQSDRSANTSTDIGSVAIANCRSVGRTHCQPHAQPNGQPYTGADASSM